MSYRYKPRGDKYNIDNRTAVRPGKSILKMDNQSSLPRLIQRIIQQTPVIPSNYVFQNGITETNGTVELNGSYTNVHLSNGQSFVIDGEVLALTSVTNNATSSIIVDAANDMIEITANSTTSPDGTSLRMNNNDISLGFNINGILTQYKLPRNNPSTNQVITTGELIANNLEFKHPIEYISTTLVPHGQTVDVGLFGNFLVLPGTEDKVIVSAAFYVPESNGTSTTIVDIIINGGSFTSVSLPNSGKYNVTLTETSSIGYISFNCLNSDQLLVGLTVTVGFYRI